MKKIYPWALMIFILGLSTAIAITLSAAPNYVTKLSKEGKIEIVEHPQPADYSKMNQYSSLPAYKKKGQMWQVDLRSADIHNFDVKDRLRDLLYADFDSKTKWPPSLPKGFNPPELMELGKNPGLQLRTLHQQGITGQGVGIAIIDQGLLVDHIEYKDRLKLYEKIHCGDWNAQMHGPAVASIAVGKNVGVAPGADLYYIAETHGTYSQQNFQWDLRWLARSVDRIVTVNKQLPRKNKIRVISISLGINRTMKGSKEVLQSIAKAKKSGIYVVYVGSNPFMGVGRDSRQNPDDFKAYVPGEFWLTEAWWRTNRNDQIFIPMDCRCTASPTGNEDYVFYRMGGMSCAVPYVAGLYALACQVKPSVTPEVFWKAALATGEPVSNKAWKGYQPGKMVNPDKLIDYMKTHEI